MEYKFKKGELITHRHHGKVRREIYKITNDSEMGSLIGRRAAFQKLVDGKEEYVWDTTWKNSLDMYFGGKKFLRKLYSNERFCILLAFLRKGE